MLLGLRVPSGRLAGRAVLEATAKDKKAAGKDLSKRIDGPRDGDHTRRHTQKQAHEIRHFGNDIAQGDFVDPLTKEDAEELIELMVKVLDEVCQSPARLERVRIARLATKEQATEA